VRRGIFPVADSAITQLAVSSYILKRLSLVLPRDVNMAAAPPTEREFEAQLALIAMMSTIDWERPLLYYHRYELPLVRYETSKLGSLEERLRSSHSGQLPRLTATQACPAPRDGILVAHVGCSREKMSAALGIRE
jgi:hypothetical protein